MKNTTIIISMLLLFHSAVGQGTWTQKTDFAGGQRYTAAGFCIGQKLFVGAGANSGSFYNDFWSYDPR